MKRSPPKNRRAPGVSGRAGRGHSSDRSTLPLRGAAQPGRGNQFDLVIVGAGPAGVATALHLLRLDPTWADRLLILEAATHPREKLCGGGVTRLGEDALAALGLELGVPSAPVYELRSWADHFDVSLRGSPVFRVVERARFDAWLLREAEKRGATVRQGERVVAARRYAEAIEVSTERETYRARVVVAADGAVSSVRRLLHASTRRAEERTGRVERTAPAEKPATEQNTAPGRSVLMETIYYPDPPETEAGTAGLGGFHALAPGEARFDFRRMAHGLQGYVWHFPAIRGDRRGISIGLFDSRVAADRPAQPLRRTLRRELPERPAAPVRGFPLRRYEPRRRNFSAPRLLYVGDAAGSDPMLGEGISFALGYGEVAAGAIVGAFETGDFTFHHYYRRVHRHPVTSHLQWRRRAAQLFYGLRRPATIRALWAVIPIITRLLILLVPRYIPGKRPRLVVRRPRR